jgi:putative transposase
MTHQDECPAIDELTALLVENGPAAMASALATLMNHAMQIDREQVLKAESHQRTADHQGYANGFKPKTLRTRVGRVELRIPQTRDYRDENGRPFYPQSLERGVRSERAMTLAVAEMYVQGVSTRKATAIVEELCGLDITSTQVIRAAAELDEQLGAWPNRPIGEIAYLILDARYEKVRHGGAIVPCALLTAIGVGPDGKRSILGCSVQLSEAETHWRSSPKASSIVGCGASSSSSATTTPDSRLPDRPFSLACPGNVASSIVCRMPWCTCQRSPCERRSLATSAASSTRTSLPRPSGVFGRNTTKSVHD